MDPEQLVETITKTLSATTETISSLLATAKCQTEILKNVTITLRAFSDRLSVLEKSINSRSSN